jgi:hypothetical protein
MPGQNYDMNDQKMQEFLTETCKEAEQTSHFVQRNSKLDGTRFVQTLVLGCLKKPEMSLSQLAEVSTELGTPISGPGLDQRIDKEAVIMLQEVLREGLQRLSGAERLEIGILAHFSAVYLLDSTQMQVPAALSDSFPGSGGSASPAGVKIQVLYDYLTSRFVAIELGPGNQPDQRCRLQVTHSQAGALHLFDLGYFSQQVLAELAGSDAYFISRFDHQTALFSDEAEPVRLELLKLLRQLPGDRKEVWLLLGRTAKLRVRALFQRLPQSVAEERRRKAIARAKDRGHIPSDTYLELLGWHFFISNIPEDWLTFDQILLLYRVRWQVELLFKLWKSQAGLDHLGPWRKERLLTHLYARLIGLVLFYALAAPFRWSNGKELSFPKAFSAFQDKVQEILRSIRHNWCGFSAVLLELYAHWQHYDLKTHRRKNPSTLELLLQAQN